MLEVRQSRFRFARRHSSKKGLEPTEDDDTKDESEKQRKEAMVCVPMFALKCSASRLERESLTRIYSTVTRYPRVK